MRYNRDGNGNENKKYAAATGWMKNNARWKKKKRRKRGKRGRRNKQNSKIERKKKDGMSGSNPGLKKGEAETQPAQAFKRYPR